MAFFKKKYLYPFYNLIARCYLSLGDQTPVISCFMSVLKQN